MLTQYKPHPIAEIFPLIFGDDFVSLKKDIKEKGLLQPIWLYEGMILDGRNRFRACQEVGAKMEFQEYTGNDPVSFVISLNLKRRHLDESQRAMVAAKVSNLPNGANQYSHGLGSANLQTLDNSSFGVSQQAAADLLNVGTRSVASAKKVINEGDAELINKVEKGDLSVSAAATIAELPREEQKELIDKNDTTAILAAAKEIRNAKAEQKRAERVEKIIEISKSNAPLEGIPKCAVIYCDPPWRYEHIETESRAIENQYPTMTLDEIKALPIQEIALDDSVVFMWATSPKLLEAFEVLAAWGYSYRTCAVWDKEIIGMGYYFRQQHELLLVATKGNLPTPLPGNRPSSVYKCKRELHSAKPHYYYEMLESMYGELPKVELFSRTPREGWYVWGNQSNAA